MPIDERYRDYGQRGEGWYPDTSSMGSAESCCGRLAQALRAATVAPMAWNSVCTSRPPPGYSVATSNKATKIMPRSALVEAVREKLDGASI